LHSFGARHLATRLAAVTLLAASLACFALPWLTVTQDNRIATATGVDLIRRDTSFQGSYVHEAYEGEVEALARNAETWARVAFAFVAVALVFLLVPWRPLNWAGAVAWALGTLTLLAWTQVATVDPAPPYGDRHGGFWLALGLTALAAVPIFLLVSAPKRTTGGEWLDQPR
jgi:hypothetical protein